MSNDVFKGQWKQLEGKVRQQWGKLTDDDVSRIKGDRDVLVGRIQERYGRKKDEVLSEIEAWVNGPETPEPAR
jgi:uncharacterized protein YjbJ (UPF0337 family)